MCWCTPEIRTPWCGKPGCVTPRQDVNPLDGVDTHQALPVRTSGAAVQDLLIHDVGLCVNFPEDARAQVIADIDARKRVGLERYGTLLQAFNGRDALLDAYQESLDLCVYLRQALEEDAGKGPQVFYTLYSDALQLCLKLRQSLALRQST